MSSRFTRVVVFVLLTSLAALCPAQSTRGTLAGTITDPSGAVVSGAPVEVQAQTGGEKRNTVSGPNGEFRIEALDVGVYSITVSAPSFSVTRLANVQVDASQTTPVSIKLVPGKASETVTVEASAAHVQTESGELSGVISETQIKDLPLVTGNPYELAEIMPGVAPSTQRDSFTNGVGFSVDGLRPRANNFLLDGFDNNDNGISGQALQPTNQEAVSEVVVLKNGYSAEYGRGGGSVTNLTFKSGTNNIHGGLWEQYSGNALFAVTPEEAASGLTNTPHAVNNLFGFRVGGPILKNKLYYFGTSQWTRLFGAPNPLPVQLTIPTAAGASTLQSLGSNNNAQILLNSLAGLRAPISDGSPIPIGARPGCPAPCTVDVGLFTRTDTTKSLSREWTVRGDYNPSESDTIFARYTDTFSSLTPDLFANSTALPSADTMQGGPARNLGVMWAHTFGPRVVNELRFSGQQIDFGFNPTAATLANPLAHLPGLALASSLGNTVFGGFAQATFPQGRSHKTIQFQDAVSFNRGTHTFKIGADIAVLLVRDQIPFNSDGTIVFSSGGDCSAIGLATCTDLANYLDNFSGPNGTINKQFGNPTISVPTTQQAYYFQDSWKVRPNLTLEYGVRYEYQPPDASNVLPFPAVNRATALTAPFQQQTELQPDRNNWGPRLGFSYGPKFWQRFFGEDKTVIRGGVGIFYDAFFTNISNNTAATAPNTLGGNIFGGSTSRGTASALATLSSITPTVDPTNLVESVVSNLKNPQTYQWNLNVQRELPGKLIAEVAYVGTRGERLWDNEQLNPVDPNTGERLNPDRGSIILRGNRGDSIYHGLQTQVTRNVGKLSIQGSYTFSRAIDNQSEVFPSSGGASRWEITSDPRSDRGPSAFDHKHRGVVTWVYQLPSPSQSFLKTILGGWVSTGSASFITGAPETVYLGGWDQNGDGEAFNDRPFLGNIKAPVNESPACLASPTCVTGVGFNDGSGNLIDFIQALFGGGGNGVTLPITASQAHYIVFNQGSGKNGNVGRNSFYFPGRQLWNLGAIKRFQIPYRESQVEFRADFFDAFNHPNEGADNLAGFGDLLNPGVFGNFRTTRGDARTIQFWLKYAF